MPLVEELVELYWKAYNGRGAEQAAATVNSPSTKEEVLV